ncbi:hypothetical protein [Streptococcus catagoni]|uniref:hypothetical protein n=1 Tax=Streptococcus catagoni TaxID=2654874 RepID=UPI00140911D8|nr:hypothetical protein [Streptococcus catagoni]
MNQKMRTDFIVTCLKLKNILKLRDTWYGLVSFLVSYGLGSIVLYNNYFVESAHQSQDLAIHYLVLLSIALGFLMTNNLSYKFFWRLTLWLLSFNKLFLEMILRPYG